jgi:hypothetical protein
MKQKILVGAFACFSIAGCYIDKDIQVEIVNAQLVKVDTIYRNDEGHKLLTWLASDRTTYYSFENLENFIPVGTSMRVLVKR